MKPFPCASRGSTLPCASLLVSLLLLAGSVTSAQVTSKVNRASTESLTQSLMALNAQYQAAPPAGKSCAVTSDLFHVSQMPAAPEPSSLRSGPLLASPSIPADRSW